MSSVQFLTQTTINGDTHSEGIFSESLLCVESKGVGKEPEPMELACAEVSFLEHLGIAAGKIKLRFVSVDGHWVPAPCLLV